MKVRVVLPRVDSRGALRYSFTYGAKGTINVIGGGGEGGGGGAGGNGG